METGNKKKSLILSIYFVHRAMQISNNHSWVGILSGAAQYKKLFYSEQFKSLGIKPIHNKIGDIEDKTHWLSCNHIKFLLLKSVRANLRISFLEKCQITEIYWKNCLNSLYFLPIQNVRQYHFHDVAKYE